MGFNVKELDENLLKDLNRIENESDIDARLVLRFEDNRLSYTAVSIPHRVKQNPQDEYDYSGYPGDPDKTAFLAYMDSQVAGEIVLRKNWNKYALVEWIGVDRKFRRKGIGRALISQAQRWAKGKKLPGIMLETQDINVVACRFYESCGFVLKGFDTGLYAANDRFRDEIALFWYLDVE